MKLSVNDLERPEVINLLREHLSSMENTAPAESRHALDLEGLRSSDITFWTVWDGAELAGFGALKHLSKEHAEVKSMRTSTSHLRKGVAANLLRYIIHDAKARGYKRLSLETGSMDYFAPARKLYTSFGFKPCPPFENYTEDSNSVFMTKSLYDENA